MPELLCLRFRDSHISAGASVGWTLLTPVGQVEASGHALLSELANVLPASDSARRCIVIVGGEAAFLGSVEVPPKQQRHIKQLVPFLVEEQIVEPIEAMHLAMPVLHDGERVAVATLKRDLMEGWLAQLLAFDIAPDYLFLDVLCVPCRQGEWQLLFDADRLLFRDGQHSGMLLTPQTAETVLKLALAAAPEQQPDDAALLPEPDTDNSSVAVEPESDDIINRAAQRAQRDALDAASAARVVLLDSEKQAHEQAAFEQLRAARNHAEGAQLDSNQVPSPNQSSRQEIPHDPHEAALLGEDFVNPAGRGGGQPAQAGNGGVNVEGNLEADIQARNQAIPENWLAEIDAMVRSENVSTAHVRYSETVSEMLAVSAVQSLDTSLNLLQGEFRPATANAEQRRFLRKISAAVAACVALFLVITLGGGFYLNARADHYFDRSVAMYRELFPKQRKVIDPVRQMKRQLRGSSVGATTSDFLPLLDAASRSLQSLETTDGEEPAIQQLRYDTQRGHIAIDLHASNIDQLEAYRDLLTAEGLEVDILSANQDGDSIKGRIQVGRS